MRFEPILQHSSSSQGNVKVALSRLKIPLNLPLQKGDFLFPPLKRGSCEKIRDLEKGASESLRNFLNKSIFAYFFTASGGRGDFCKTASWEFNSIKVKLTLTETLQFVADLLQLWVEMV